MEGDVRASMIGGRVIGPCVVGPCPCGGFRPEYPDNNLADWIKSRDPVVQPESLVIRSVPRTLRLENEEAYTPRVVCIGLLHRGKSTILDEMEKEKELKYMFSLFGRTGNDAEQTKAACMATLTNMVNKLREFYPEAANELDVVSAVLVDSCFIIELLYKHYTHQQDPILDNPVRKFEVQRDLLLLENQIPFSALEELFNLTVIRFHNHVPEPVSTSSPSHTSTPQPLTLN